MNIKAVKKHILERLAHGEPIQVILNPQAPMVQHFMDKSVWIPDPEWIKPDLPDWNIVVQWMKDDEIFEKDYQGAFKYGGMYLADYMLVLKDQLLKDPKAAPAYKAAMEMVRMSAMWRDSKYSERMITETKNTAPLDAEHVVASIKELTGQLSEFFGKQGVDVANIVNMGEVQIVEQPKLKKPISERMRIHLDKARAAKVAKQNKKL